MILRNFELHSCEIHALGYKWDLHNWCDFEGIAFTPELGTALLKWRVMTEFPFVAQIFEPSAPAVTIALRISGLQSLEVTRAGAGELNENAKTLHEVKMVDPREKTPGKLLAVGYRTESTSDDGHLLLEFMDGYDIEIVADEATFEAEFPAADTPNL